MLGRWSTAPSVNRRMARRKRPSARRRSTKLPDARVCPCQQFHRPRHRVARRCDPARLRVGEAAERAAGKQAFVRRSPGSATSMRRRPARPSAAIGCSRRPSASRAAPAPRRRAGRRTFASQAIEKTRSHRKTAPRTRDAPLPFVFALFADEPRRLERRCTLFWKLAS